jgi:hypothetical protein
VSVGSAEQLVQFGNILVGYACGGLFASPKSRDGNFRVRKPEKPYRDRLEFRHFSTSSQLDHWADSATPRS